MQSTVRATSRRALLPFMMTVTRTAWGIPGFYAVEDGFLPRGGAYLTGSGRTTGPGMSLCSTRCQEVPNLSGS
ncbi:rCG48542 [Rattus norvegicus]|uniref:RCG48542 n=1 Tax=Rattus norvegicus TaxID=10116 RepID=A6HXK6_RAT|nr:rCG48542 [Rattus norvegicus]